MRDQKSRWTMEDDDKRREAEMLSGQTKILWKRVVFFWVTRVVGVGKSRIEKCFISGAEQFRYGY